MSNINTGKVVAGGLLAGLVFNVLDFANNALFVGADFRANATRLGLDPAAAETSSAIAKFVVVDFLFGILTVFIYAAIRPRFGPGVKTAVIAGLIPWASIVLVMFIVATTGVFPMALYGKMAVISAVTSSLGAIAGAWAYKES
jgi:hypothetical protein